MSPGYLFIFSAAFCWGLIGIFSSIAFSQGMGPMEVAFWRICLAWICFALQAFYTRQTSLATRDIPLFILFALLGISLFYTSYLVAVQTGGAAFAAVLLYTAPAWVVCTALIFFKEKLTRTKVLAVALVIMGVFLISQTGGNDEVKKSLGPMAIIAGLTAGFCYSLYYTMGKYFSSRYSSANLFLYTMPLGALFVLPFVDFVDKTPMAWAALITVSVICTFLANYCYYQGLKVLEAGRASIVATIEPVIAAIAAYLFLGEYFKPLGYLGAVLIIAAVVVTIREK